MSPSFVRGDFARRWAALLNENLDPENKPIQTLILLAEFVRPYRNFIYTGKLSEKRLFGDAGREWREARSIEKKIIDGQSIWTKQFDKTSG